MPTSRLDTDGDGDVSLAEATTGFSFAYSTASGSATTVVTTSSTTSNAAAPQTPRHQRIVLHLAVPMASLVRARRLGAVYVGPLDVVVDRSPVRTRRPDLFFLSTARQRPDEEPEAAFDVAPDLIVEVLAPTESRRSLTGLLTDYTAIGVSEVWLASPQAETIEVLRATTDGWETAALYGPGTVAQSEALPGYTVDVDDIFA